MRARRVMAIGLLTATLTACGDEGAGTAATTTTVRATPRPTVLPPTSAPASTGKLSRAEVCRQYLNTIADFRMDDQQSFVALSILAQQTADRALAAAIQKVADDFRRHAPAIYDTEVKALC